MSHGLVADYTDSEEEEQEINEPPLKKLKLPNPLKNNSFDNEEVIDDPALHDFRVRSFPHVRGNWATYVFIQPSEIEFSDLQKCIHEHLKFKKFDVKLIDKPHLSVSRVVTLQHIWINSFTKSLQHQFKIGLKPFRIRFEPNVKILVNEEKTRTFIGIDILSNSFLKQLVKCCDQTLIEFNKEAFFDPPDFHISLAWCLGDQSIDTKELSQITQDWINTLDQPYIEVNSVNCKIGNKLFELKL